MANKLESQIEKALMSHFHGLKCRFVIQGDTFDFKMLPGSKERFDEQYPGMSKEQADAQILQDLQAIISKYIPSAQFVGYERYGNYSRF